MSYERHYQQMARSNTHEMQYQQVKPMSRTDQYRKVMKPLIERKRRARINRCLDELKDLMVSTMEIQNENVQKMEKADILEFTVQHLQKLRQQKRLSPVIESDRYRAGFTQCAKEVSQCLASIPGVNLHLGTTLMTYLGQTLKQMDSHTSPLSVNVPSYQESQQYQMPLTPDSSRASSVGSPGPMEFSSSKTEVWRPW